MSILKEDFRELPHMADHAGAGLCSYHCVSHSAQIL